MSLKEIVKVISARMLVAYVKHDTSEKNNKKKNNNNNKQNTRSNRTGRRRCSDFLMPSGLDCGMEQEPWEFLSGSLRSFRSLSISGESLFCRAFYAISLFF